MTGSAQPEHSPTPDDREDRISRHIVEVDRVREERLLPDRKQGGKVGQVVNDAENTPEGLSHEHCQENDQKPPPRRKPGQVGTFSAIRFDVR